MVENMAGEDVPKLISAAEDSTTVLELMLLRLTVSGSGIPEVVKTDETAVAAMMEEITSIAVESVTRGNVRPGLVVSETDTTDVA